MPLPMSSRLSGPFGGSHSSLAVSIPRPPLPDNSGCRTSIYRKIEYCRTAQGVRAIDFPIDQIIAEKHNGQTVTDNLRLSCYWCNSFKGSDLSSADWATNRQIVPLFNPRQHIWHDHFNLHTLSIQPLTI